MVEEDHPAFPYSDAFRKAKRNSLIWSGITIAAALGSPPVVGGEATLGQLGLSLTYDKSVLIGMSGTVAIFMAAGFYQAYQRIKLHASQLFAGQSDVAEIFTSLSVRAATAIRAIDDIVRAFDRRVGDDVSGKLDEVHAALKTIQDRQIEEGVAHQRIAPAGVTNEQLLESLPQIRTEISNRGSRLQSMANMAQKAMEKLELLKRETRTEIGNAAHEEKQEIGNQVDALAMTVKALTGFHDGIYRSEKVWFYVYDVAPVIALFLAAMIPFGRLFVA